MTESLDIDSIMKGLSSPDVGKNADSLLGMVKEVNTVLKEVQKTVDFLDKCGIKPLLVRAAGQKLGIDVDTPLAAEHGKGKGIDPQSKTHAQIFHQLNNMTEQDVIKLFNYTPKEDKKDVPN